MIYGMMANVSIGSLFLGGVIPGVLMTLFMMMATVMPVCTHQERLGLATRKVLVSSSISDRPMPRRCVIVLGYPDGGVPGCMKSSPISRPDTAVGFSPRSASLLALDYVFQVLGRDGADDAGHPDRRHDAWLVHADRGRRCRRDVVAVPRPRALSLDDACRPLAKATFRYDRDDGVGAVHRDGRLDLRVAADGERRRRTDADRTSCFSITDNKYGCSWCW